MSACTDAINSAFHYKSAGRSQAGINPSTQTYLCDDVAGKLMAGKASGGGEASAAAPAAAPRPECTVALTCNRETSAPTRSELSCYGMVAVVCSHTVPCPGLALPMPAHERHSFYVLLLSTLLERRSDVKFIYLDLMCRFADKVAGIIQRLEERGVVIPDGFMPELLLPWMHAFDHNKLCQYKFSPLYCVGAGRRVGEQTEQFWAMMKPFAKLARYMAWHRYWDGYNFVFHDITLRAQASAAATLRGRIKRTLEKLGEMGGGLGLHTDWFQGLSQLAAHSAALRVEPPPPHRPPPHLQPAARLTSPS